MGDERSGIAIRPAGIAEAVLLAELGARLFEQTFAADNTPQDMGAYLASAFGPAQTASELADRDRSAWIAEAAGGEPVGYAIVRRGTRAEGIVGERPAEVQRLYVDEGHHGRGVGRALMETCVARARSWGADVLWLGVWERNGRAIAFYEKSGFVAVGSQTFLLGSDPQTDVVMQRTLGRRRRTAPPAEDRGRAAASRPGRP